MRNARVQDEQFVPDPYFDLQEYKTKLFQMFEGILKIDGFASLGLAKSGMFYQLFKGVDAEKVNVTIDMVDQSTGEVMGTVNCHEAIEYME
ncbi:hypothetical protein M3193_13235 [Sporosarcina luteola]|nr:hypothetical protein [Sporosarcina luteola]